MNEDEKVCPYCGGVIKKVAIKCKHCKALLNKEAKKPIVNNAMGKRILKVIAIFALVAVMVVGVKGIVSYAMSEIESNKLTDNGYKSIVRSDDYKYVSHYDEDLSELTYMIPILLNKIAEQEKDLMKFFKKSTSKEDNVKLFNIFMTNVDKYKQDVQLIHQSSSTSFESLGIITSEPILTDKLYKIAITNPAIKSFYLLTDNRDNIIGFFDYDYKYMLETYAPYLSDDWKEYFALELESKPIFRNLDWDNPKNIPILRAWGKKWGAFVDKYPNFIYASEYGEYAYELNSYMSYNPIQRPLYEEIGVTKNCLDHWKTIVEAEGYVSKDALQYLKQSCSDSENQKMMNYSGDLF